MELNVQPKLCLLTTYINNSERRSQRQSEQIGQQPDEGGFNQNHAPDLRRRRAQEAQ